MSTAIEKEIVGEAERLDVKEKAPLVLAELLYTANIVVEIKKYRTLFLRVSVSIDITPKSMGTAHCPYC